MSTLLDGVLKNGEPETRIRLSGGLDMDAVGQAVCALANQRGGFAVWGVDSEGRPDGLQKAEERAAALTADLGRFLSPAPLLSVVVHPMGKAQVVVAEVGAGTNKPYAYRRGIWIRLGEVTLMARESEVSNMVADTAALPVPWEEQIPLGLELEDLDKPELAGARAEVIKTGRLGVPPAADDRRFLEQLYLVRRGRLTRAAAVLFASDPRVWAAHVEVRLHVFGSSGDLIPTEMAPAFHGPAIRVLRQVEQTIMQRTPMRIHFDKKNPVRLDLPAYPLFAIREGLVNAIVHRDYARPGAIIAELHPERLVYRNPGQLPEGWGDSELKLKHMSHCINPNIARLFLLRGWMEQVGMGAMRLVEECVKGGAKQPQWVAEKGEVRLTLFAAPAPKAPAPSPRLVHIERLLAGGKALTITKIAAQLRVTDRQARRYMAELVEQGIVRRVGSGPKTTYERKPE